jgi:hypothetical protein
LPLEGDGGSFTVLVLETDDRVVTSSTLERGLSKAGVALSTAKRLLVCAYNLTEEVRATLGAVGSLWVAERDFYWTDERYHQIRQPKPHDDGTGA